jgi:hypothetical protein
MRKPQTSDVGMLEQERFKIKAKIERTRLMLSRKVSSSIPRVKQIFARLKPVFRNSITAIVQSNGMLNGDL